MKEVTTKNIEKEEYIPTLDDRTMMLLSKAFFSYTEMFGLKKKEMFIWLGLAENSYNTLKNYKKDGFKKNWDIYTRVADLLGIVKSLKVIYPRNKELFSDWLSVPRDLFHGKSAREFIVEKPHESALRIKSVRRILDMYRNGSINDLT